MPPVIRWPALEPSGPADSSLLAQPPVRILIGATLLCLPLVILAILAPPAVRPAWDNAHWSVVAIGAAIATAWSVRGTTGRVRVVRTCGAVVLALWLLATLARAWMTLTATPTVPSIIDVLIVAILVPALVIVIATVHGRLSAADEAAVYLDSALGLVLIGSLVIFVFGPSAVELPTASSIAAMAYPTVFLGLAGAGLLALLASGHQIGPRGALALAAGSGLVGLAYLSWIGPAMNLSNPGALSSELFTIGTLAAAFGSATWTSELSTNTRYLAFAQTAKVIVGPLIGSTLFLVLVLPAPGSVVGVLHLLVLIGAILLTVRQVLIVRERTSMLATVTELTRSNQGLVGELRRELRERTEDESVSIQAARADAVGSLSASVGHEVNNPLTGVLGYAELVLAELPADHPSRPDVETIRVEALRARQILIALRDYASPRPPQIESTDLAAVLRRTVLAARPAARRAGITIDESVEAMDPILVDERAVELSVAGILANACQATLPGGRIAIAARRAGDDVVIVVSDDGIGMDEVTAQRAFEPFFSGWPTSGSAVRATGLGLSIGNGLIGSLGGKITLDSSPGRGTSVEIRLRAVNAPAGDGRTEGDDRP